MARRILLILGGALAVILGLGSAAAALLAYGLFGAGDTITLPAGRITGAPDATAIVIDLDRWDAGLPVIAGDRRVAALFRPIDGGEVFVGLGRRADVDAFLIGTPTTVAVRDDDRWQTVDVPGSQAPGPPSLAPIWLRSSSGPAAAVWVDGVLPATLAIMRPEPTAPLDVLVDVQTTIPGVGRVMFGLAAVAVALVGIGISLIVLGARRRSRGPGSPTSQPRRRDASGDVPTDRTAGTSGRGRQA